MLRREKAASLILFSITPRFEVFYALQALAQPARPGHETWKRETGRSLPRELKRSLQLLAPSPLLWPLLADALRDAPPMVQFGAMIDELRMMDVPAFQHAILSGVFKRTDSVKGLISGERTLAETVAAEAAAQKQLLTLLGLVPFRQNGSSARAFGRLVDGPGGYRTQLADALESFWDSSFAKTWEAMKPKMLDAGDRLEGILSNSSLDEFARVTQLPIRIEDESVVSVRGSIRVPLRLVDGIHLIPSAFNSGRFWAAYADTAERTRFFVPLLDAALWPAGDERPEPAAAFKALGDTTRYAIASMIARTPMTSVELARAFAVSKPTISHHVQLLRSARLLEETTTENGVMLSLNRAALERVSGDAAVEMFSATGPAPAVRRTRK